MNNVVYKMSDNSEKWWLQFSKLKVTPLQHSKTSRYLVYHHVRRRKAATTERRARNISIFLQLVCLITFLLLAVSALNFCWKSVVMRVKLSFSWGKLIPIVKLVNGFHWQRGSSNDAGGRVTWKWHSVTSWHDFSHLYQITPLTVWLLIFETSGFCLHLHVLAIEVIFVGSATLATAAQGYHNENMMHHFLHSTGSGLADD